MNHKTKTLFIYNEKLKVYIKNNGRKIKIAFLLLLLLFIYIFGNNNMFSRTFHKKYAIQYIKNFLLKYLNNSYFIASINDFPNISVIIPLYNCQNSIEMSILSIQLQYFKNYEIILINDYSNDNTSNIVNKIKEKDSRIKIINNKKNMGVLYSRSIGALNAKGKYIFCLDNDDLFFDQNLFGKIFEISESKDYDIVEFKSFYVKKFITQIKLREIKDSPFNDHPENYSLNQPELGLFPISRKNKFFANDHHLWGKSIKAKIYKNAIKKLIKKNYLIYNCWTEDISVIFIIFNISQTFFFVGIYGIIHLDYKQSTAHTLHHSKKLMGELFLLNIIIEFIKNIEINKSIILQKLEQIIKSKYYLSLNSQHMKALNIIYKKIIKISSLTNKDKKFLSKYMTHKIEAYKLI